MEYNAPRPRRPAATAFAVGLAVATVTALGLAGCSGPGAGTIDTVGAVDFRAPLAIPPLAASTTDAAGTRVFDLDARAGTSEFTPGVETPTSGFNQDYLGPTLVAERGERVRINVENRLDEATTVHWHGMHLPARMDGGPHQPIEPGATWSPEWTVDQPAATLWYHPHPHGETENQLERGLAGMVILRDEEERALGLPSDYGVDDIPVIVQDRRFEDDGSFTTRVRGFIGPIGDQLLVNGTLGPYLDVTTTAVRLRLLNGSSARVYNFAFSDDRAFELIGTDGGLLAAPAPMTGIRLSPGERAEVIVRMTPGETVTLRSTPPELGIPAPVAAVSAGADSLDVLQLVAAAELVPAATTPAVLAGLDRTSAPEDAVERAFVLAGTTINDRRMEMDRIDETVTRGRTEVWAVRNTMSMPHNFHVHGTSFRVLSVDGDPPQPELSGWKDTVYLPLDVELRLVMRFDHTADPDVPYMYHCHLLAHEDSGMMGQFVVLEPGRTLTTETAETTETEEHHDEH